MTVTVIQPDERATFTRGRPNRYVFGPAAQPLLVLNDVDAAGCAWVVEEPKGWDAPTVNSPIDRRQQGHGGYLAESYLEERTLTFTDGLVTAPSNAALLDARERWLGALLGDLDGYVLYTHADEPGPWSMWLRPAGTPRFEALDDRSAVFGMVMVAEDPLKFGPTQVYGPARLPTGTGDPGRVYGRTYGYTYNQGAATRNDVAVIPGGGNEWAHAIYTVTGPVPQPRVQLTSGQWFAISGDLGQYDVLTLDTLAGTVQVNGVNRPDLFVVGSVYPLIPPGGTEVRLRSQTAGTDPAAGVTVTTAPRRK